MKKDNSKIISTKKFEGRIYYKVISGDKEYILRKVQDDDIEIVDYNKYSKIFEENVKKQSKLKTAVQNTLMPVILTTMITSSLTGCGKKSESNAEPTRVEVNQDLIDAIKSGKKI